MEAQAARSRNDGSEIGRPLDQTPLVLRSRHDYGSLNRKSIGWTIASSNDPDYRKGMSTNSVPEAGRATFLVFVKCRPKSMNGFSMNRVER
jgi:hypothetical protein